MNIRQIQEARELYGIDGWGASYFSINEIGHVACHPTADEHISVDLPKAIEKAKKMGIKPPMILRFPQIIDSQMERLHTAFKEATKEYKYEGKHHGVFPFKVNQRYEFIESIVNCGNKHDYGLEVGSKAEFIAALSYDLGPEALLVCNGFKDKEFIDLGFIAAAMGKNVIMVVEGPDELQMIIDQSKRSQHCPQIGIRAKLYSCGSGKWAKSSGETSKFGLTTIETLHCLDMISRDNLQEKFSMLHFHIGSQVTEIKRIKNAIKEASRVYAKVYKMGFRPVHLNIGGGIGVDYDGSKTSYESSANYSLQEFANNVVYEVGEVCKNENVPCPNIVTESGRVIAAYHSVVVTNIREIQGIEALMPMEKLGLNLDEAESHKSLHELKYVLDNINRKNYSEYYHDALQYYEEMFTLFSLGYVSLKERALAEQLFFRICQKALYCSSFEPRQPEEFADLQQRMVSKYLANFSIFQSIPDAWSINQLFPVMPLSDHEKKPTLKATIVDITCDSDGCLEKFVDRQDVRNVLDLHTPSDESSYYLGFFLVGAYQESLANEHNLFGAINEAEIIVNEHAEWEINKITKGDAIDELLACRNYDIEEIVASFQRQLNKVEDKNLISDEESQELFKRLNRYISIPPYLTED